MRHFILSIVLNICLTVSGQSPPAKDILYSTNPIEIRLWVSYLPTGSTYERIIFFDSSNWHAYEGVRELKTKINILKIADELNSLKLHKLKNQSKLRLKRGFEVDDGAIYQLSYKKGDKYYHVSFQNPDIFAQAFPSVKEFRTYNSLVNIFYKLLYH